MGVLLAIGTKKGLFLARRAQADGEFILDGPHFPTNSIYAVAIDQRRAVPRILAGVDSSHWGPSVFRSDDMGATWSESEGGAIRFPADSEAALERVWQLQPGPPDNPDVVWAGTSPAALFRSDDGGATFALVKGLWDHPHRPDWEPGAGGQCLHSIVPHPTDPARMLVAISTGGVYATADGGATWQASNHGIKAGFMPEPDPEFGQCVHKIAVHPDRPEQVFLQNHGGVYRSDDGSQNWIDIGAGLPVDFGFSVMVHPRRPGTAYVYPMISDENRLPPSGLSRVYRTEDAGSTWEALSSGLPQDHGYLTVLRDAMCADDSDPPGIYLGSRTGEVFTSVDGGDSWSSIASHLQDVLVVRAATVV